MAAEHDKRYKKLFSHPVLIKELLTSFVHEDFVYELDFSTLQRLDKSFITDEFKEKESDLIYKIELKDSEIYIYLLLEFQSTVDRFMALRMLRYICEFYEFLVQNKMKELPPVFPILLYNGEARWTALRNFKDLIIPIIPEKYLPHFQYYPIIENEIDKDTLLTIKNAVSAIFYIENSNPDELKQEFRKIIALLEKEEPEIIILFRNWINNYFGYKDAGINNEISDLEEVRKMFATKLKQYGEKIKEEALKEGVQQGIQKGIEKGIEKGTYDAIVKTAKKMLSLEFSLEDIIEVTGLSRDEIEKL